MENNYYIIIIGAGIGGLSAAAKLTKSGLKTLLIEKIHHIGGTSSIFKRGDYYFPMGPLSFSHPNLVKKFLLDFGIDHEISFKRSHFQFITPYIDIIYSQDWQKLELELIKNFPAEQKGINEIFSELGNLVDVLKDIQFWHPDYTLFDNKDNGITHKIKNNDNKIQTIKDYLKISSKTYLEKRIKDKNLIRLLGSQGSYETVMSLTHLAFMWNVMSKNGI